MEWSDPALALFKERAIDPDVATAAGVREEGEALVYPTGKRRSLNGGQKHTQPSGANIKAWPLNWTSPAPSVLVTEGETDGLAAATALVSAGPFSAHPILALPACTYPPNQLAGVFAHPKAQTRDAFLALDPDEAGQKARARITVALEARGIRAIPVELPDGFDLAAWIADGGDLPNALADAEASYTRQRQGMSFAEVAEEPIRWLWRNRVPRGHITVVAADPGMGKSTWTCLLAAELSRQGHTTLMANDEDPPARVRERLVASDADLSKVRPVDGLVLPDQTARLAEQVAETGADLITIDPYNAYLADSINALRDQQVRGALAPLLRISREHGCGVVIVCHLNRSGDEENPIYRIPVGLRGIARSILMMQVDDGTYLLHRKSSYGPLQDSLTYHFENGRLSESGGGPAPPQAGDASGPQTEGEPGPIVERDGSSEVRDYTQMGTAEFDD